MRLWKRAVFAGLVFLILLLAPVPVLITRPPLVLVTDAAFTTLYGKNRVLLRRVFLSLRLFRWIKTVPAAEGAGPDLVSLAVWNASKQPHAVFFPFRYLDGARRYAKDHPDVNTAVLAGRTGPPRTETAPASEAAPVWLAPDTLFDSYRAGFYASAIALERDPGGLIAVFHGGSLKEEEQEAFGRGVRDYRKGKAAFEGEFLFLDRETGKPPQKNLQNVACAVVVDGNTAYAALMNEGRQVPLVLFTWITPAVLPGAAVVVFDDSPWEILPEALDALERGGERVIPSGIHWREKNILKNLTLRGKKLNFRPRKADN